MYETVHRVKYIWDANSTKENWGFLLVDEKNVFNGINRIRMLWTVRHLWSFGSHFVFNCYHRNSLIVLRNRDGTSNILQSWESVTQVDPLTIVAYMIGVLLLIKYLKLM